MSNLSGSRGPLPELALLFLKLGVIGFGGPAAHIALMEEEVVRRRQWLTREQFLDLLGATNLIPGPNSTEMAIHIGRVRAGFSGLMVAGACFILPAMLMVMGCAWAYVRYRSLPQLDGVLYGVKPVIIVIVLQALISLGRTAIGSRWLGLIAIALAALSFAGVHELLLLLMAGILAIARLKIRGLSLAAATAGLGQLCTAGAVPSAAGAGPVLGSSFGLWPLFLFFLKVGSVLYGSGYVLLAFLRAGLVERWGWLTEAQLLDAVAVGQVTPGPVFTTATFIGYILGGTDAALIATLGIFLPSFVFVAISGPLIPRIRRSPVAGAFLDGVNAGSLALMAVVTVQLSAAALTDKWAVAILAAAAVLLFKFKINSAWLIAGGAAVGLFNTAWMD